MRPPHTIMAAAAAISGRRSSSQSNNNSLLLVRRLLSSSTSNSNSGSGGSDPISSKGGSSTSKRPRPRPTPPGTFVWRDVPYYHHQPPATGPQPPAGEQPQQQSPEPDPKHHLDIYVAAAPFPRPPQPVLVFVHGGLWVRGDRQHPYINDLYDNVGAACARAGVVGVVISYRLAPQVQHPEQCRDVARALRWTTHNAPRFGGDPTRLVLAGASAGAHLCATLLASPHLLEEEGLLPSSTDVDIVRGLVGLSGVYNLERLMHKGGGALAASSLLPAVFGEDPAQWPHASPTHILRTCSPFPVLPLRRTPLLLLNAAADFHLEEDTAELLELLGDGDGDGGKVHRSAHVVPGTDHLSLVREVGREKGGVDELVFGFVRRVLAGR